MPKLLLTVTAPQAEWLKAEAQRLDLPGGVSELLRRLVDRYREPAPEEASRPSPPLWG